MLVPKASDDTKVVESHQKVATTREFPVLGLTSHGFGTALAGPPKKHAKKTAM